MEQAHFKKLETTQFQWIYDKFDEEKGRDAVLTSFHDDLSKELQLRFGFSEESSSKLASKLIAAFKSNDLTSYFIETIISKEVSTLTDPVVKLTQLDYSLLLHKLHENHEEDPEVISLLLAFMAFYRYNFHPSGWIRYDKKNVFHLAGLNKISISKQRSLTGYLHTHYNLDMQVVGSNQPIPCFGMQWLKNQPAPGSEENPFTTHGPLLPETIDKMVKQITDK